MAGNGNRDVQLTISAKNQATAAIDSVAEALKTLAGIQDQVGASAKNADGLLGELGSELANLTRQAEGLKALGTVAKAIETAAGAVQRLQSQVGRAGTENEGLVASYEQAALATKTLAAAAEQAKVQLDGQRAALAGLRAAATRDSQAITAQKAAVTAAAGAWRLLQTQLRAAQASETQLAASLQRSTAGLEKQQGFLAASEGNLAEINGLAAGASASLGGVAASQEAVGAAAAATAVEIARVNTALLAEQERSGQGTSTSAGPAASATSAYRAQVAAVEQARQAYAQASAAATQLGAAMARAEGPTEQLNRDFILAKAAAAQAKSEYQAQSVTLNSLRGVSTGTFRAFSVGAGQMRQAGVSAEQTAAGFAAARERLLPLLQAESEADQKSRSLGATLRSLLGVLTEIPQASGAAADGVERLGNSGSHSLSILTRMRNEMIALTTAYVGFYGAFHEVGQIVGTFQTLQNAQQRLSVAFGGSMQNAASEMSYVHEQALRLGFDVNELAEGYSRVAIAAQGMGYSTEGTREIFTGFAEAARVAGMSTQATTSALRGLFEMIDRGTINARNFNLQMGQQVPFAIQAMAQAVGVSEAKFTQLQKTGGGVAATEETLVKFTKILSDHFANELPQATQTLTAQLGRFQTRMRDIQEDIAKGGFVDGLTKALNALDEQFKSGAGDSFLRNLGAALGTLVGVIPVLVANFGTFVAILKVFVGLAVAKALLGIVQSGKLFGVTFAEGALYVGHMQAALAGLGGETGTVAVAMARLRVATATASMQVENMSLATALLAAREATAAVANGILAAGMTALRGAMIITATAARALWIAIGGFPGLIITALTFIVSSLMGDWLAKLGTANDLMSTHEQIMEKVRQAYVDANGDAAKLRDTIKDLSTLQIEANKSGFVKTLSDSRNEAGRVGASAVQAAGSPNRAIASDAQREVAAIIAAFQRGAISAEQFKAKLNAIGEANPGVRDLATRLQDVADKGIAAEKAIGESDAALRVIHHTATDADKALFSLGKTVGKLNDALDPSVIDRYKKALLDLGKDTPGVQGKMAALQEKIQSAKDTYQVGISALPLDSKNPAVVKQAQAMAAALKAALEKAIAEIQLKASLEDAGEQSGQKYVDSARHYLKDSPTHNSAELKQLFARTGTAFDPKWCADFINAILKLNGTRGSGSGAAKDFLSYGSDAKSDPQPGDIVVIKTAKGYHAGIYAGLAAGGRLDVIGGNQHGGQVNEESFSPKDVVGIRRPPTAAEQNRADLKGETETEKLHADIAALIAEMKSETAGLKLSPRDAFIASKVDAIQKKFDESGPTPENPSAPKQTWRPGEKEGVARTAGDEFDARQQLEEVKKVAAAQLELNALLKGDAQTLTKDEFVRNEAIKDGVNLLDAQGQKYAALKGRIYDLQMQQKAFNDVIAKGQELTELGKQLTEAFKQGDGSEQAKIAAQIRQIKADIVAALPAAQQFAAALGDPKMVAELQKVNLELRQTKTDLVSVQTVDNDLASGFVEAFDKSFNALGTFMQGLGTTHNLLTSIANAWRAFAANFLQDIANMILKQLLLNALSHTGIGQFIAGGVNKLAGAGAQGAAITTAMQTGGATAGLTIGTAMTTAGATVAAEISAAIMAGGAGGGAGGLGGLLGMLGGAGGGAGGLGGMLGMLHGGGIVGRDGMTRRVSPLAMAGALRFHEGGFPGLSADEVPAILKRNEEVLTENNPRHLFNQGGNSKQPPAQPMSVKIVNAPNHGEAMSEALKTDIGEHAILNHMKNNRRKYQTALGITALS
jgi:uncharacterized protein (TIGR02594 family)